MLLEQLNEEQQQAVQHEEGPLLILAGAGSGKTRVITHRIAWLICEKDVSPDAILAMTFTNKAAEEMEQRVADLLHRAEAAGALDPAEAAGETTISTFHSLGARLLRRHGREIGLDWNMTILDPDDQLDLVKETAERAGFDVDHGEARRLRRFIERMKNRGLTPRQAFEQTEGQQDEADASFYEAYQQQLRTANCADFGELLLGVLELFRQDPMLAEDYSFLWQYVTVDEFQDTNPAQYELLEHLTTGHDNLAVVGDDDQAIYRWRDATVENILGFEDDFKGARVVRLERNYRSTERILNAANDIIQSIPRRREKQLWTEKKGGEKLTVFTGRSDREEAEYVAKQIDSLVRGNRSRHPRSGELDWKQIAVFYRVNALSRQIEEQLRNYDIPYQVVGGTSFYERAEIKDVLAYLRLALNPSDDVSCLRIIGTPPRGVGDVTVEKLRRATEVPGIDSVMDAARYAAGMTDGVGVEMATIEPDPRDPGHYEALEALDGLGGRPKGGLTDFCELIVELRDGMVQPDGLAELVQMLIDKINYLEYLQDKSDEDGPDRVDNVRELMDAMRQFEEAGGSPLEQLATPEGEHEGGEADPESLLADEGVGGLLREFLERSSLVRETDEPAGESVTLMTIHGAKGLEFDTVFVVGVEDRLFPNQRQGERLEDEKLNEERRLAYVAITRAESRLFLTNAKQRRLYGKTRQTRPSRFLLDIDEERLQLDPMSTVDEINYRPRRSRGRRDWSTGGQNWGTGQTKNRSGPAGHNRNNSSDEHYFRDEVYEADQFDQAVQADSPEYFSQVAGEGDASADSPAGDRELTGGDDPESLEGVLVHHNRFGPGRVESVNGEGAKATLDVYFPEEATTKTIKRDYVEIVG